jgi:hypothetical protein
VKPAYIPESSKNAQAVEPLSESSLVGKWLLLNSEGGKDGSGNYLFLDRSKNEIKGELFYQNNKTKCTIIIDSGDYYIITLRGERYKISRSQSILGNANNGIWLSLDDIDLGVFQRDDVLEKAQSD